MIGSLPVSSSWLAEDKLELQSQVSYTCECKLASHEHLRLTQKIIRCSTFTICVSLTQGRRVMVLPSARLESDIVPDVRVGLHLLYPNTHLLTAVALKSQTGGMVVLS